MKTLNVDIFNPASIQQVIDWLNDFEMRLPSALDRACERLASLARETADWEYSGGAIQSGNFDYDITIEKQDGGYMVSAFGEQVGFLEFGAGDSATENPFANDVSYDVYPGSYSELGAGHYAEKGYWYWKRIYYKSVTPTAGMFKAYQRIQEEAPKIIIEELSKL